MSDRPHVSLEWNPTSRRLSAQQGLTLIELVLALVVVVILGGVAASYYFGYMAEARMAKAISDMRNIALVLDDLSQDDALPNSLAVIGADRILDPWGNPYQYLRIKGGELKGLGKMRKDKSLVPLNSDYDLYSMGPDGDSKPPLTAKASHDDVIRANNGAYFGAAQGY
jgi:general secretion pathway protein G